MELSNLNEQAGFLFRENFLLDSDEFVAKLRLFKVRLETLSLSLDYDVITALNNKFDIICKRLLSYASGGYSFKECKGDVERFDKVLRTLEDSSY